MAEGMSSSAAAKRATGTANKQPDADLILLADREFHRAWLERQCRIIPGASAAILMTQTVSGPIALSHWPAAGDVPAQLALVAERALSAARPVVAWARQPSGAGGVDLVLGVRVETAPNGSAITAGIFVRPSRGVETVDPEMVAEQLRFGDAWFKARRADHRASAATAKLQRTSAATEIVALASSQRTPDEAASAVVGELAQRLYCDRVSLGDLRRGRIKLRAMSHLSSFQTRGQVVDAIEEAMEECLLQAVPVAYPMPIEIKAPVTVAHRALIQLARDERCCASVLLPGRAGPVGVLTFERRANVPFDTDTLLLLETIGAMLGPVYDIQRGNHRIVAGRIVDAVRDGLALIFGRERPSLKLAAIVGAVALIYLSIARSDYRVTARATMEGEVQRAAVAPFDGFIATAPARPGDHVSKGDLLAAMDERDLVLERTRAWADRERLRQKHSEAMAKHDRPAAAMLAAQIEQAEAQFAIAEAKLERARIVAPIDGLVVSGDLSQMLGAPIERGKTMFEIAPLDRYRIALRTDERDIPFVAMGQHGLLSLAGKPADRLGFTVTRVTPVAEAKDGKNEFRVEAVLDDLPGPGLRPGMEGVGKVETGPHSLVWIWSHGVIGMVRMLAWKWLP